MAQIDQLKAMEVDKMSFWSGINGIFLENLLFLLFFLRGKSTSAIISRLSDYQFLFRYDYERSLPDATKVSNRQTTCYLDFLFIQVLSTMNLLTSLTSKAGSSLNQKRWRPSPHGFASRANVVSCFCLVLLLLFVAPNPFSRIQAQQIDSPRVATVNENSKPLRSYSSDALTSSRNELPLVKRIAWTPVRALRSFVGVFHFRDVKKLSKQSPIVNETSISPDQSGPCASSRYEDNNQQGQPPLFVSDISGRVIDEVAPRQPISGVCMFLFDEDSHKLSASAVADNNGSFKFEGSYWGSYRLLARANSRSIANIPLIIGSNARRARGQITIIMRAAHDNSPSYAKFEPPPTPPSAEGDDVIVDGWKMGDTTVFEQTLTMNLEKDVPVYELNIDDSSRTKHFRLRLEQNFAHTARPLAVPCWTAVMSEVTKNANGADVLGPNLLSTEGPGTGDYFPRENNANFLCPIEKPTMLWDRGLYPVRTRRIFYVERFLVTLQVSDYVLNAKENRLDKLVLEIGLSNN